MNTFLIVTPSFNQAQFIQQTIDSVLSQKGTFDIKYVIIDGKSSDRTPEILKDLPKHVYWISEKDNGQTHAINKGINYFKKLKDIDPENTYFAYINSDDYYLENAFNRVKQKFNQDKDIGWVVGDAKIVNEQNQEIQKFVRIYKTFFRYFFVKHIHPIMNTIPQPSTFIRWRTVLETGLFDESLRYTMDYEYWTRLFKSGTKLGIINESLAAFRIHSTSKGNTSFKQQFEEQLTVTKKYKFSYPSITLQMIHNRFILLVYNFIK
jgi:glycosyltransferase involved in cell wall biosynthesis